MRHHLDKEMLGADAAAVETARSASESDAASHVAPYTPDLDNQNRRLFSLRVATIRAGAEEDEEIPSFIERLGQERRELLEALKRLADCAEANERVGDDCIPERLRNITGADIADAINAARVAIAKAEGRS